MLNYSDRPLIARKLRETKDCFVRALAVSAKIPYAEAHRIAAVEFERHNRQGTINVPCTLNQVSTRNRLAHAGLDIQPVDHTYKRNGKYFPLNIRRFYTKYSRGSYLILVSGHALAIIDGQVQDWEAAAKHIGRTVIAAYRVSNGRQLELFN